MAWIARKFVGVCPALDAADLLAEEPAGAAAPHYEENWCELQGGGTPCDTSSGMYYATTNPLTPRLCPRHFRELCRRSRGLLRPARKPNA